MKTGQAYRKWVEQATAGAYPAAKKEPMWHPSVLDKVFYGPACVHFVGFKGDEYTRAVQVFGRPDFIHRKNDIRLQRGGELAPYDTVVYANGSEAAVSLFAVDDSNVDVQAFEKALRRTA